MLQLGCTGIAQRAISVDARIQYLMLIIGRRNITEIRFR